MCFVWISVQTDLFPYTALSVWFYIIDLTLYRPVFTICTNSLTFNKSTFCQHSKIMCFLWISEHTEIFPYITLTDWYYNINLTLYRPMVTICITSLTFNNSKFCPHSEFMFFVWISEQTEIFPYTFLTAWIYKSDLIFYGPVVTICTTSLAFNNSTLRPHSEFLCFVWISVQT